MYSVRGRDLYDVHRCTSYIARYGYSETSTPAASVLFYVLARRNRDVGILLNMLSHLLEGDPLVKCDWKVGYVDLYYRKKRDPMITSELGIHSISDLWGNEFANESQ